MIKGIYNENEFYTNYYWDSKFAEDLRSKIGDNTNVESKLATLKALDAQFWDLKEIPAGDPKRTEILASFYRNVFQALGYSPQVKEHQTSTGKLCTLFVDVRESGSSELFAVLVDQAESGDFEMPPIFVGLSSGSELEMVDYELSQFLQEEFQESQNPPRWILVGAPNALFIMERNKWSFGRYLRIDWQEVFLQRDVKPYELLYGLAAKDFLCPGAGSSPHDEFDDSSHRHAFEVTTELRESVREAVELLINEMIDLKKEGHQKIYSTVSADQYAKELTHDALYYVYRLLFLLYLEAQGEDSELLPLKSEIYRNGYSLEKLLELDFIDIVPGSSEANGTFLFDSLDQIFHLIYYGFDPGDKEGIFRTSSQSGFLVKGIKSDLFDPQVIKHLKGVRLRNGILLEILKKLSLTRKAERGGRARARVSYANLGINQLGSVYESLLSYTGFFAQEDLHALKPASVKQTEIDNGQELDQIFLAPKSIADRYRKSPEKKYRIADENVVRDEAGNPKIYKKGSFVYRLAGRDRQKLASYYTPESLTKSTVKYSLKVLFEAKQTLEQLWSVKILEPAMGSGAFLNEAVNQLAEKILELEVQQSIGDLRTPRAKQKRVWEIKWQLIASNVYGVDLNPTAIELARFSLWLNCIGAGKEPPSFEGRLKVGNSLIGARFKKNAEGIYPWLFLDDGMLNYGVKTKEFSAERAEKVGAVRTVLIGSQLKGNEDSITSIQVIASRMYDELAANNSALETAKIYERLKACCDLWCSFFFFSADDLEFIPKSHEAYLNEVRAILTDGPDAADESLQKVISRIASDERFFHWEIEFPKIIRDGGFDLILGNPPWVAVAWHDAQFVSDDNVIPSVAELNAADTRAFIQALNDKQLFRSLERQYIRVAGYSNLLEVGFYHQLKGVAKNTYKAFDILGFYLMAKSGAYGVIQEDGILEDKDGQQSREELYKRFRYHFQFQNEKFLFAEVGHAKRFSVNIFGDRRSDIAFDHIGNLYLPNTIDLSYECDGQSAVPLIKDELGNWEVRGHRQRIVQIDQDSISLFNRFLGNPAGDIPVFLSLHSSTLLGLIKKLASAKKNIGDYLGEGQFVGSEGFHETGAQDKGYIKQKPGRGTSWNQVILSGPQITVGNPISQECKEIYKSKFSYDSVDLQKTPDDFVPRTLYQLSIDEKKIDSLLPSLGAKPYRSFYRFLSRKMINQTNERCLFSGIVPPGTMHIDGIVSLAALDQVKLVIATGFASSLIADGILRLLHKANFRPSDLVSFPVGDSTQFFGSIGRRTLSLCGLTKHFSELWKLCGDLSESRDALVTGELLKGFGDAYDRRNTLRTAEAREQALVEIDALVALSFGLSAEELIQVYEILFPVLNKYDRESKFNRKDMLAKAHRLFERRGW